MRRTRGETRTEIWEFCYGFGNRGGATRRQIAENLGVKKTPHLIGIINEMVNDNWLECRTETMNNGAIVYLYDAVEA